MLVILLLVFVAVTLSFHAFLSRQRVEAVPRGEFSVVPFEAAHAPSTLIRVLFPLLNVLAPLFALLPFDDYRRALTDNLRKAGFGPSVTVNHVFALKLLSAVLTPMVLRLFIGAVDWPPILLLTMAGGFMLPDKLINDIKRARWMQILRTLPGAVEGGALGAAAGHHFQVAMQRFVERGTPGALRDEFSTILNDMRLGKTRGEAIRDFGRRVGLPEVGSFVSVLVQADSLGVPIGEVLRSQAAVMRVQRFQRAEQEGARASQKLLVPLVLFIFPAVLIVILGPVVLHFMSAQQ
jgi:tight adherence protein C